MKTVTRNVLIAILMLGFFNVSAQKPQKDDHLKKKIQSYNETLAKAIVSDDQETVLSFYTNDAVSLPNYSKMLVGLEAIAAHQKETAGQADVTAMNFSTQMINDYGKALVEIGIYTITVEVPGYEKPYNDKGKYVSVWEKQANGEYKMAAEIWNTDVNPMQYMNSEKPTPSTTTDPPVKLNKNSEKAPGPSGDSKLNADKKK